VSLDGDHVRDDLRERFDEVLGALERAAGWQTERMQRPVLIIRGCGCRFGAQSIGVAAG